MENGKVEKAELLKQLTEKMLHRTHVDGSMQIIEAFLFGPGRTPSVFSFVREHGLPIVDDWGCLKSMVSLAFSNL